MKYIKRHNGIRNKILFGFTILAVLLFFSGLITYFELKRLDNAAAESITYEVRDVEFSRIMTASVQSQNFALFGSIYGNIPADSVIIAERSAFEAALAGTKGLYGNAGSVARVIEANKAFNESVDEFIAMWQGRYDAGEWFSSGYRQAHDSLMLAINDIVASSRMKTAEDTVRLKNEVYRSITPSLATLAVAIVIIIVFFMLIDLYYIKPVLDITKGLGNYLNSKVPFNVKVEGRDEIFQLKEYLSELLTIIKRREP